MSKRERESEAAAAGEPATKKARVEVLALDQMRQDNPFIDEESRRQVVERAKQNDLRKIVTYTVIATDAVRNFCLRMGLIEGGGDDDSDDDDSGDAKEKESGSDDDDNHDDDDDEAEEAEDDDFEDKDSDDAEELRCDIDAGAETGDGFATFHIFVYDWNRAIVDNVIRTFHPFKRDNPINPIMGALARFCGCRDPYLVEYFQDYIPADLEPCCLGQLIDDGSTSLTIQTPIEVPQSVYCLKAGLNECAERMTAEAV